MYEIAYSIARDPPRSRSRRLERRESAKVDARDAVNLDEDHHDAVAVSAPDDLAGRPEVDAEFADHAARSTARAGPGRGRHLLAEDGHEGACDRVPVKRFHTARLRWGRIARSGC